MKPHPFILNRTLRATNCLCLAMLAAATLHVHAGDADAPAPAEADTSTRYGLFNGLDHRSSYGLGVFPEPFLVDDSDLEVNEARVDWFYSRAAGHQQNNVITGELEKGFGNLTLEIEVPYEIDKIAGRTIHGWDNIDLGARYPLFEAVSKSGNADTTFGVAIEVGIPTTTVFSKNTEFVPKVFNDTRFGNFTIQSIIGYSMLYGPGDDGGLNTFEYGFTLGYAIQKPLPGVDQFIPIFELSGEKELNHDVSNSIIANAGFRVNLKAIGRIQPRLGIGYVFPLNRAGEDNVQSGVYTSLVFEF
jgi:hypothetical protein